MKPTTVAVMSFFGAAAIGVTFFLWSCSSGSSSTVCTDAGIDATPTCVTTTTGGGGW